MKKADRVAVGQRMPARELLLNHTAQCAAASSRTSVRMNYHAVADKHSRAASADTAMSEPIGAGGVCRITATGHKHRRTGLDALTGIPALRACNSIVALSQAAHRFEYAASRALIVIEWHSFPCQLLRRGNTRGD
jgi:hypothetical protein